MKCKWLRLAVSLALLLLLVDLTHDISEAQVDLAKALVGKWEGEIAFRSNRREDPNRTLIITSVEKKEDRWVASGSYGFTGKQMGPVNIEVNATGQDVSLSFSSGAQSTVRLTLTQGKYLLGMWRFQGAGDNERSIKLEKVQ